MNKVHTYPAQFLKDAFKVIDIYFDGDQSKTNKWFKEPNENLGMSTPDEVCDDPMNYGRVYNLACKMRDNKI